MLKYIRASQPRPDSISSVQIDATRWRHRKIPLSRGGHITGRYSPGPGRPGVMYESLAERRVIAHLYSLPGVLAVHAQPFTIEYRIGKSRRSYTPDLLVFAAPLPEELSGNGFRTVTIVEVKAEIDPTTHVAIDFKLHLSIHATGLAAVLVVPTKSDPEVDHAL